VVIGGIRVLNEFYLVKKTLKLLIYIKRIEIILFSPFRDLYGLILFLSPYIQQKVLYTGVADDI